jgi:hypothetical protein
MASTNTGDAYTMSATTEQKTASGWPATTDTTTDNGTTMRTMVRDIGDGTSNEAPTLVHNDQPHVRSTQQTERDASSAMICHGDDNARITHANRTTDTTMRSGRSGVSFAISLALPADVSETEFSNSFPS